MKKTTRFISALVASLLLLSLIPMTAFAAERDPLYADIKNYDAQRQYAVENCKQPELKQWVLDNIGRKVGGCQMTPMAFAVDVFGVSLPLSTNLLTLDYWANRSDTYCEYWRFIPYSDSLRFEAGDVLLYPKPAGGEEHYAIYVGETTSYWKQYGIEMDAFAVVESNRGSRLVTLTEEGYGNFVGILRPDFSQTLANRPNTDVPTVPDVDAPNLSTASAWAHDGINSAVAKGFVPADLQDKYTNTITRAEFCRMAVKWLEYKLNKPIDTILSERNLTRNPDAFSDTKDPDILAAYALGITSGTKAPTATASGTFSPTGSFDRQQAAVMIMNTLKASGTDVSNPPVSNFTDRDTAAEWARTGIDYVRANGIMQGTSTTPPVFSPLAAYTREQSIITFNNISE